MKNGYDAIVWLIEIHPPGTMTDSTAIHPVIVLLVQSGTKAVYNRLYLSTTQPASQFNSNSNTLWSLHQEIHGNSDLCGSPPSPAPPPR